jgi:NAD/NADP transhydrogenase beta subunit
MRKGLRQLLLESFLTVHGVIFGVSGILLALVLYLVLPSDDVVIRLLVVALALTIVVAAILVSTLLHALARQSRTSGLPRIRAGRQPFTGTSATLVCLADPSELFYTGIWVSFYRVTEQSLEVPIGLGTVVNVQEDGRILLEMTRVIQEHEDFAQRVRSNDAGALENIRVRPSVPQQLFGSYEERR